MKAKALIALCAVLLGSVLGGCGQNKSSADTSETKATTEPLATVAAVKPDKKITYEYDVKEIWCENNGKKIYGEAYIPRLEGKLPLVITSHGLGSNHYSGASYAQKLAPRGFAVYTFDFCGGTSPDKENKSDGEVKDMSVMTEVTDLEAVLKTAKTWEFADKDRIFLLGGSQGGLVSAITGVKHEDEIAGLVLLYPAFNIYDYIHSYCDDYDSIPESYSFASITMSKKYGQDLWDYDVRKELPDFDKPVIIIQGTEDDIVLPSTAKQAADLYPNAEYKEIEGANHGFFNEHHDKAAELATEFLYKHI